MTGFHAEETLAAEVLDQFLVPGAQIREAGAGAAIAGGAGEDENEEEQHG